MLPVLAYAIMYLISAILIGEKNKIHDAGGEVVVPRRIIKILEKKYGSQKSLSYLCGIYLDEYLK